LTRFDPSSILKRATYAYSFRKSEIIPRPHIGHRRAKEVRRALAIERPKTRKRVVARLSRDEERKLIAYAYRVQGTRGLLIKTLFQTGARVSEFVNIKALTRCFLRSR
jgi:integrase